MNAAGHHELFLAALAQELTLQDPYNTACRTPEEAAALARDIASTLVDSAALWADHLGGCYSEDGAARILGGANGPIAKQALSTRHDLLALRSASGQVVYPRLQFRDGQPLPGIAEIVKLLPPDLVSPWTVASWLASGTIPGHDAPPVTLLKAGAVAAVVAAAREWAQALRH